MPIELTPTGEVVTMECFLRTPSICLYPEGVGHVLLYKDDKGRLWNVCKACAERAFSVGDWYRSGEKLIADGFVSQYQLIRDHYQRLGDVITVLLQDLIASNDIRVTSISYRLKTLDSLQEKINRKKESVEDLADIQDLLGVRIIAPFADDVEKIGYLIEQEFDVLSSLSLSKLTYQQDDLFGYPSPHYVVRLSYNKRNLPEYKLLSNLQAELQVRSILQHAWTELSHEFQYKRETEIPTNMKRQFHRLSGLLEVADQEFVKLRDKAKEYREAMDRHIDKKE